MSSAQRVVLIDDSSELRLLTRLAIEDHPDLDVVAEADDGFAALRLIQRLKPDVAVIDIHMPRMTGIELIQLLRFRGNRLKIIAHSSDAMGLAEALTVGADAAVMKSPDSSGLLLAIAS